MFICKLAGFFTEKMSRWCLNCCQDKFQYNFDFWNSRALEACTEQNTALQKCFQRSWYPICRKEQEDYWNCYRKETVSKLKNLIFIVSLNVYQYCLIIHFIFPKIKYYFLSEGSMQGSLVQSSPYPSHCIALRLWLRWGKGWCRLPPDTFFVCLLTFTLQVRREPHSFRSETLISCQLTCTNQPISHTCLTESSQPLLKKCRETRKGAPRRGGGGRYVLKLNFKGEVMLLPLL